jgi:chromosome segregation ATPase
MLLESTINNYQLSKTELSEALSKQEIHNQRLQSSLTELNGKLLQADMATNSANFQNGELEFKFRLQNDEISQLNAEISNLNMKISQQSAEISQLNQKLDDFAQNTNATITELDNTKHLLSRKEKEISDMTLNIIKLEETVNNYQESIVNTTMSESKLHDRASELKKQNHKLKEEVKKLTVKSKKDREFLRVLKTNLTSGEETKTSILEKVVTKDKQIAKWNDRLEKSIKDVTVESIMNSSVLPTSL